jgi:hypothetical protein
VGQAMTRISVKIGTLGDRNASDRIHERILQFLKGKPVAL